MSSVYNSAAYFQESLIEPSGFREYDARWTVEPTAEAGEVGISYFGVRELGLRLGQFLRRELNADGRIIVGHDYRRYSENVKNALAIGLVQAGMAVTDIGLCTSPGAYFAQFDLDISCVAMVTASHNENGWSGVKMGTRPARTFGPAEMDAFRSFVANPPAESPGAERGSYTYVPGMVSRYIDDLVASWEPRFRDLPRLRVAVETGNGTAGLYLPEILTRLGFDLALGNVKPDWTFPNFNPNPENIQFLRSVERLVTQTGSDVGICVDGDGDRLGVIDDEAKLVFADKIGLLIARHLQRQFGSDRPIVIDVKSTSLFQTELRTPVVWAKTGHSYVKAAVAESQALAGFERSGHFFFREPLGRGYDDACVAALATLWMICSEKAVRREASLAGMLRELPPSFASPNRQPFAADDEKYHVVERISAELGERTHFAGKKIIDVNTLNGIRITLADQSWLLVRASSNTPNLVIIAEVFDADGALLAEIDAELRRLIDDLGLKIGPFEPLHEF